VKLAIVSDIHGNLEAFDAVLSNIQRESTDAVVSLGDNIGYGPDPELVNLRIMDLNIASVLGNHEYAVLNRGYIEAFNVHAKHSIELTIEMLSEKSLAFISNLPCSLIFQDCRFVHGVPPDSPTSYFHQFQGETLDALFHTFDEPVCFVGHTHKLDMAVFNGKNAIRTPLGQGVLNLDMQYRYIINVGSVGQPRDGGNRAKYSLWDTKTHVLENRAVAYDVLSVVEKIESRGFPRANALRLI
jgi:predicted phosphodiesterase